MKTLAWIALLALLAGCATAPAAIATAVMGTQAAWTPVPTQTPYPTNTPASTYTPAPTYTAAPTYTPLAPPATIVVTVEVTRLAPEPATATATPAAAASALSAASGTPLSSPTPLQFQATVTPGPGTPLPPSAIIGQHVVQPGETIFCIGRAYGVLPAAIAQANGLSQALVINAGQVLKIPAVQWFDIAPGPVCVLQFASPFPGLATLATPASLAPTGAPLTVSLNFNCSANCAATTGNYEVRVNVLVSGGIGPYNYDPASSYAVTVVHCTTGQGVAAVTSADGQTAQAIWTYHDIACP